MKRSLSNENDDQLASTSQQQQQHYMIDSNTIALPHESRTNTAMTSTLNNLSPTPKTILRSQQSQSTNAAKNVTIHSQPEIIQLQSNGSSFNTLSNPCYFASANDPGDRYDIEQHMDNRVVISIRGGQTSANHNNNNNNTGHNDREVTQF